jgi:hypothetical protein
MSAVLEHAFTEAGIASLGLWVQVPHYVGDELPGRQRGAARRSASKSRASHRRSRRCVGDAEIQRVRIDQLVGGNDEHQAMVQQLETAYDAVEDAGGPQVAPTDLPSADELAAEVERFLRDQGD